MLRGAGVLVAVSRFFSQRCDWLALRFNSDCHLSDEVRRDLDLHLVRAELLQRFIKKDLVLLHGDAAALERVSDLLVGDGVFVGVVVGVGVFVGVVVGVVVGVDVFVGVGSGKQLPHVEYNCVILVKFEFDDMLESSLS